MRILVFIFLFIGTIILVLGGIIRMEDKYPRGETRHASCKTGESDTPRTERAKRARALMLETLERDNGAGIAAAVMIDGQLIWADAVGHADRRTGAVLKDSALMRTGSVSKPITAALAAKLYEQGVLDIDAPIQRYLPEFPEKGAVITIRMLAGHLSGLRQYDFANFDEANNRVHLETLSEAAAIYLADPLISIPGEEVNYTSLGYNLIGAVIERVTGKSFDTALQESISKPMSLNSFVTDDAEKFVPCRARFHTVYFGKIPLTTIWRDHSDAYPSAGILSTATDLAAFANGVFSSDYFAPEITALFTKASTYNNGEKTDRTFGWKIFYDDSGDVSYYGHGGLTNGAVAELRYYPQQKLAFALITNYNFWMTDRAPQYQSLYDKRLPTLFGLASGS